MFWWDLHPDFPARFKKRCQKAISHIVLHLLNHFITYNSCFQIKNNKYQWINYNYNRISNYPNGGRLGSHVHMEVIINLRSGISKSVVYQTCRFRCCHGLFEKSYILKHELFSEIF